MKRKSLIYFSCLIFTFLLTEGCRTEFEQIRTSNDPAVILKQAHAFFDAGDNDKSQILYELAIPAYRGKEEAEKIYYNYATTYFNQGQYLLSSHYFQKFVETYTYSEQREDAEFMIAKSYYQLSPNHQLDQSHSDKAIESLQYFINSYPDTKNAALANKLIDEIRAKLELKAYEEGKLYYDIKAYESAIQSFENMLKDFPETPRREEIKYLIAKSSFIWAENSVYEKKEDRFLICLDKCKQYLKRFEKSKNARDIRKYIDKSEQEIKKLNNVRS